MSIPPATFAFGDSDWPHEIGNPKCDAGWCNAEDWPMPCKCGGLIHANFADEDGNGDYYLFKQCDQCGGEYEFVYGAE